MALSRPVSAPGLRDSVGRCAGATPSRIRPFSSVKVQRAGSGKLSRHVRFQLPGSDRQGGAEDYDLWFRMSLRTEMTNLPEVLLKYRRHSQSASQSDPNYPIVLPHGRRNLRGLPVCRTRPRGGAPRSAVKGRSAIGQPQCLSSGFSDVPPSGHRHGRGNGEVQRLFLENAGLSRLGYRREVDSQLRSTASAGPRGYRTQAAGWYPAGFGLV